MTQSTMTQMSELLPCGGASQTAATSAHRAGSQEGHGVSACGEGALHDEGDVHEGRDGDDQHQQDAQHGPRHADRAAELPLQVLVGLVRGRRAGRQAGRREGRKADRRAGKQAAGRQAGGRAGGQAGRGQREAAVLIQ